MAGGGCRAPARHNHVSNHFGTMSSPWPSFAAVRAGRQLVLGPVLATVAVGGCRAPRKHRWQQVVQGEAGAVLLEGCGPGMAISARLREDMADSSPPSRRDTSMPWLYQSEAVMGWCWCGASSNRDQQLSRTSREPGLAPGLCFLFLPDAQCMSVKHLATSDNPYSPPDAIRRYAMQVMPCNITFHARVTGSDPFLPLSRESKCGWGCCGGCGSRPQQGLSALITSFRSTGYNRAPIRNSGFRLILL